MYAYVRAILNCQNNSVPVCICEPWLQSEGDQVVATILKLLLLKILLYGVSFVSCFSSYIFTNT